MYLQKWLGLYHLVDAFVVPCRFMGTKLIEGGFAADRIHLINYPVSVPPGTPNVERGDFIVYVGRISYEKGLDTLIRAYQKISPDADLILIGRNYDGERERLKKLILPEFSTRIRFLGFIEGEELSRWIAGALFTVVPSRWYDNAPISIYESFIHETPVVASSIGGIPEQVEDYVSGRLFTPDSENELKDALTWMLSDRERLKEMGRAGKEFVASQCNLEDHATRLLSLFESVQNHSR
jgi:glycosyltransferase involved in cell wall biosynthesis